MNLRGSLENYLNQVWYRRQQPPWFLRVLTPVYRILARYHQNKGMAKRRAAPRIPVPVAVVGNVTVGGTGKTPLVMGLIAELLEHGIRPGLVSRGYRSQAERSGAVVQLDEHCNAEAVGDEPLMVFRRYGIPVAVGVDRTAAARRIQDQVDVIISDDGLQHHALPRDLEIVVLDQRRGLGNAQLLPAGPLREPADRLQTVDFVIEHGCERVSAPGRYSMRLELEEARLLGGSENRPLSEFEGREVQVITGIGHPDRFVESLRAAGLRPLLRALPDHHALDIDELESLRLPGLPLLITEKDAVKLQAGHAENIWIVPARTVLDPEFVSGFLQQLRTLIRPADGN